MNASRSRLLIALCTALSAQLYGETLQQELIRLETQLNGLNTQLSKIKPGKKEDSPPLQEEKPSFLNVEEEFNEFDKKVVLPSTQEEKAELLKKEILKVFMIEKTQARQTRFFSRLKEAFEKAKITDPKLLKKLIENSKNIAREITLINTGGKYAFDKYIEAIEKALPKSVETPSTKTFEQRVNDAKTNKEKIQVFIDETNARTKKEYASKEELEKSVNELLEALKKQEFIEPLKKIVNENEGLKREVKKVATSEQMEYFELLNNLYMTYSSWILNFKSSTISRKEFREATNNYLKYLGGFILFSF